MVQRAYLLNTASAYIGFMPLGQSICTYPLHSRPYGRSYHDWSISWWKWLLSIPKSRNPSMDNTGEKAFSDQPGSPVFFLCQTFGKHYLTPKRKLRVPARYAFFMPIINWVSVAPYDGISADELLNTAKRKIDTVTSLEVCMNGKPLDLGTK